MANCFHYSLWFLENLKISKILALSEHHQSASLLLGLSNFLLPNWICPQQFLINILEAIHLRRYFYRLMQLFSSRGLTNQNRVLSLNVWKLVKCKLFFVKHITLLICLFLLQFLQFVWNIDANSSRLHHRLYHLDCMSSLGFAWEASESRRDSNLKISIHSKRNWFFPCIISHSALRLSPSMTLHLSIINESPLCRLWLQFECLLFVMIFLQDLHLSLIFSWECIPGFLA